MVRTVQMGGTMAKQHIAAFDQSVDDQCNYCKEAVSTGSHIRWQCKHFEPTRIETDKDLAMVPRHLLECIRCGVAPAMKIEGELTYWGMQVDKTETPKTKELLGVSTVLATAGTDADITRKRGKAMELIEDPERGRRNARQTILMHKGGHGTGVMPTFPSEQQITEAMKGFEAGHLVTAYGDGSHTSPKTWWAALGGYGAWIPDGTYKERAWHIERRRTAMARQSARLEVQRGMN